LFIGIAEAQKVRPVTFPQTYIDSISTAITKYESKITLYKKQRAPELFYYRNELEKSLFKQQYAVMANEEEFEQLLKLANKKLKNSKFRNDQDLISFYNAKEDQIEREIKYQKIRYQRLFKKERYFRKAIKPFMDEDSVELLQKAKRRVFLARKFASDKNLQSSVALLDQINNEIDAMIMNARSSFDLEYYARKPNRFIKDVTELIESDSISDLRKAKQLIYDCHDYASIANSKLDEGLLTRQKFYLENATNAFYEREGLKLSGQEMQGSVISLKPDQPTKDGVYKFDNYVLVINSFDPSSSFERIQKGEAIINADKTLSSYIRANNLGRLQDNDKVGKTFIIPFIVNDKKQSLLFVPEKELWQYRVCYTKIKDDKFTENIVKYLPPAEITN
jgi:hypothetical protein